MKKDFINKLSKALDDYGISEKDEILKKYEKRYSFGLESGMSENEIEELLGDPIDIAKSFLKNDTKKENTNKRTKDIKTNIEIKVISDDVTINFSKDDKVHILCEDVDMDLYEIKNDHRNGVLIKFKTEKYLSLNRKKAGLFTVQIPRGKKFNEVKISTSNGDVSIASIKTSYILVQTTKGDITVNEIVAPKVNMQTVSGNAMIKSINATDISLSTVSGDINVLLSRGNLNTTLVSGDIIVKEHIGSYKVNNITGDITINGEKINSFKENVKRGFSK